MRFFLPLVSLLPFCIFTAVSAMENNPTDENIQSDSNPVPQITQALQIQPVSKLPSDFVLPSISELTGLPKESSSAKDPIQIMANNMQALYENSQNFLKDILNATTVPHSKPRDATTALAVPPPDASATPVKVTKGYGGAKGDFYFQSFSDSIIIPQLTEYICGLNAGTFLLDESSLEVFLKFIGKMRFFIAYETGSDDPLDFGAPIGDMDSTLKLRIFDPMHLFTNWYKYFTEEVLGEKFAYPHDKHVLTFIQEPGAFTSPYCQYVVSHYSEIKRLLFEKYKKHRYTLDATNAIVTGVPELHMIVHPLIPAYVPNFTVNHAAYSPTYYKELLPIFLEAVKNPTLENTARVHYFINVRSFYRRGQAAITLWLLKALLASGGKKLRLDDEIVKTGVNLDMFALIHLSFEDYLEFLQNHASLVDLDE
jgi:hypothetical protein